ncbi:MAG: efflux RND transporter periplasmic adaptor subunit, partial [Muribaculaceae bacterium]|nr:efflux RND transporter periplasmic adaptor subunit [Muribaculaceae bacterium]
SENVIVIPQKATQEIQDMRVVYVLNDSNQVSSRPITIEPYNDGRTFVVTSGLQPGDRIAVEGVGNIVRNGVTVTPKNSDATGLHSLNKN